MIKSIYIKPSRRKCSVSDYKCFDIYDQDKNKIPMQDCDVIDIKLENIDFAYISLEVVDGMIHLWSHQDLDFEQYINTFVVGLNDKKRQKKSIFETEALREETKPKNNSYVAVDYTKNGTVVCRSTDNKKEAVSQKELKKIIED